MRIDPEVQYNAPVLRFRVDGEVRDEALLGELQRVILVRAGNDVDGNPVSFHLLDFGVRLWLVPEMVSLQVHGAWAEHLRSVRGYYEASVNWPPRAWLDGGFLGLFRQPAACVLPASSVPPTGVGWTMNGPLDPVSYAAQ